MDRLVRVLVISDEEYVRERVGGILDELKLNYDLACNAKIAKEKLLSPYDIVISDALIWGMSAIEVVESVKKIRKDVCIIVMCDLSTTDIGERCIKNGAFAYVIKPPDIERIKSYVELYLITKSA
ncbi:MAG: response regulator [Elusimicrobiales bacterium]